MRAVLTSDWSWEQLAPYGPKVTEAINKLAARFPKDVNPQIIMDECVKGERQLWLVLEGDEFRSCGFTKVINNVATGTRTVLGASLAGENGLASVPLISEVENWGREQGAADICITGRLGWRKVLAAQGYALDLAYFRKSL